MIILKNNFFEFSLLVLIKLILEYAYVNVVSLNYGYSGFLFDFSFTNYIIGWLVYIFGYVFLLTKKDIYIYEIFYLLFFIYILPTIVFYELAGKSTLDFFTLVLPYFLILLFVFEGTLKQIKPYPKGKVIVIAISLLAILVVIFNYYISTGGKVVLSLTEVYDFREEFEGASGSGLFGYLNSWVMKIFLVIIYAWAFAKKNIIGLVVSIFFILVVFALSGHKEVLSGIFLIFFFNFLFKLSERNRKLFLLGSLFLLFLVVTVFSMLEGVNLLGSIVIRRLFFVPIHLNFTYLEFFSNHEHVYWSNSILKQFFIYPYSLDPAFVIGNYLGVIGMSANTGFIATGFMHASYFGIFFYVFLAIVFLNIINIVGKKSKKYMVLSIVFLPINALFMASDLFSTLLTHGLLIAIVLLWLYEDEIYTIRILGKDFKI
ncbi:hypothetical protein GCM10011416_20540 [Polaribacter pacificus]|uniref:Oligosaccharide repeat unit polymerase n=1 Tax=Polaribacter pacificus TaxID=1775173 RepID=A0A917MEV2_9FLAO|nr:O-antigen polymerase [Polaribacter pacificus]GGH01659.1 hypothetical protein GCM10011416_20540 [Polaribacter pacificus]